MEQDISQASIMVIITGLLVGIMLGFVLQRGRYCMNSAFRDVIFVNDMTLFRAWLLALVVAIIGANLMEDLGFLGDGGLRRQAFTPIAAIVGGYLFGLGIVIAGGCGTGVLYKQGEGQLATLVATFGFVLTLLATIHGPLKPINQLLRQFKVSLGEGEDAISSLALWDILGGANMKWIVIAIICAIFIFIVVKGKPFGKMPKKGWLWSLTGLLLGLVVVFAWWASYYFGGQARGVSAAGPTAEAALMITIGNSMARNDPMFDFWGIFIGSWSALYVIGIPLGSYISAKGLNEFKLTIPRDANEVLRVFLGGMVMGFGAGVAGGCTVGHSLTGVSALSLQSILATIFIILGNWTMTYFMFIKPMQDE
ncbi:MAG TPA: YeeE/YedE family protein [Nitrospirae bacterium]|nr:YeeE/YedE family protein [Nitrospirota bacterium]